MVTTWSRTTNCPLQTTTTNEKDFFSPELPESVHRSGAQTTAGNLWTEFEIILFVWKYDAFFSSLYYNNYGNIFFSFILFSYLFLFKEFCRNLQVLDVSNVASLGSRSTSIAVDKLQRACPQLRVLRAANINFTPTVCNAALVPVLGFPHLEELSIPFHESFMMTTSMLDGNTDWTIELLTKGAQNLTLLDIRGSRYISPRGLIKIPTWSMKYLSISNCPKLEDETLEMVFTKVPLKINHHQIIYLFLQWRKTLVDIDLSWNKSERCMNACIEALCENDDIESQLRSIQLRGSAISYELLCTLLQKCTLLTSIDLQSCRGLPRGIKRAFNDLEFVQLRQDLMKGKYDWLVFCVVLYSIHNKVTITSKYYHNLLLSISSTSPFTLDTWYITYIFLLFVSLSMI